MTARMTTGLALTTAILAAGLPAAAGEAKAPGLKVGAVTVSYDHRDLASEAGARAMLARLERAAYDACGGDPRRHSAWKTAPDLTRRVYQQCREDAVARAVTELGSAKLAAVHAGGVRDGVAR